VTRAPSRSARWRPVKDAEGYKALFPKAGPAAAPFGGNGAHGKYHSDRWHPTIGTFETFPRTAENVCLLGSTGSDADSQIRSRMTLLGHGRTRQFWFSCSPSNQEKRQLCRPTPRSSIAAFGLPGLLAALHSPLPHSIYIGSQLIRINAGTFGGKMVNGVGRISPTSEIGSSRH
jgi:hypothetical protein